ncbi:MAG: tetratricopeptide repeat protein, partial [Longimicrobiales bacterium]|nr:tetratricopeptide repeat protein [Longimicrobiales bacterium]
VRRDDAGLIEVPGAAEPEEWLDVEPALSEIEDYGILRGWGEWRRFVRAVDRDPGLRPQAVAELLHLAREAARRGESFQMASAVDHALALEPALGLDDLALPLARHHFRNGEYARALPLFQRALREGVDSVPEVLFELGRAYDGIGDCANALVYLDRFREQVSRRQRGEVDWFLGKCSFERARELRARVPDPETDDLEEALALVERTLEVGEPRSILGEAWFERGEILAALGRCQEAVESFRQVRVVEGPASSTLVQRAQQRVDDILFGAALRDLRPDRPCG